MVCQSRVNRVSYPIMILVRSLTYTIGSCLKSYRFQPSFTFPSQLGRSKLKKAAEQSCSLKKELPADGLSLHPAEDTKKSLQLKNRL